MDALGFECLTNPEPQRGLLSSFQVGAAALLAGGEEGPGAVFTLADMPLVSIDTHQHLLALGPETEAAQCRYGEGEAAVSAPPLLLRADLLPALLALPAADIGPRALLRGRTVTLLPRPAAELLDVDTPQALAQAAAYLGKSWGERSESG
ncbi:NTP transferase domain-containing protein [Deinococcus lacus]|uniref:NTP transferase domain-containing protein n=1 Tax=Deinococcus lacus TaxID=392561 RepID=A0ABW1YEV9_9DEIO